MVHGQSLGRKKHCTRRWMQSGRWIDVPGWECYLMGKTSLISRIYGNNPKPTCWISSFSTRYHVCCRAEGIPSYCHEKKRRCLPWPFHCSSRVIYGTYSVVTLSTPQGCYCHAATTVLVIHPRGISLASQRRPKGVLRLSCLHTASRGTIPVISAGVSQTGFVGIADELERCHNGVENVQISL